MTADQVIARIHGMRVYKNDNLVRVFVRAQIADLIGTPGGGEQIRRINEYVAHMSPTVKSGRRA